MRERDEPRTHGRLPPETALSLLSDEIRAAVLWQLSATRGGDGPPPTLSFSELKARVAPEVDSSRFNYHLQELVGHYVERVEAADAWADASRPIPDMAGDPEDGYQLTAEGTTLIRTIRAWSADGEPERTLAIDGDCHYCGSGLAARYESAILVVDCPDCEYLYDYNLTPLGVFDGLDDEFADVDDATVLDRAAEYNRHVRLSSPAGAAPTAATASTPSSRTPPTLAIRGATGAPR